MGLLFAATVERGFRAFPKETEPTLREYNMCRLRFPLCDLRECIRLLLSPRPKKRH
jgi:hypothetical protein